MNIFLMVIGILIIYFGNYYYQKLKSYRYLFEILVLGPLLVILGYTKNKHQHLKHLSSILGFCLILYHFKSIIMNSFLRR